MEPIDRTTGGQNGAEKTKTYLRPVLLAVVVLAVGYAAFRYLGTSGTEAVVLPDGTVITGALEATDTVERGAALEGRALELTAGAATIEITGADTTHAHFRFEKVARADDEAALADALAGVKITEAGDETTYRYEVGGRQQDGTMVRIRAVIPRQTTLHLLLASGSVSLTALDGPVTVENQNGDIVLRRAGNSVQARTLNGDVDVEMAAVPEGARVVLETQNGSATLGLPAAASARVEARTRLGQVYLEGLHFADTRVQRSDVGETFTGTLGAGAAVFSMTTANGDLRLHAVAPPPDAVPASDTAAPAAPDTAAPETAAPDTTALLQGQQ